MTVKEYLHSSGLNELQLSEILGYKSTSPVTKRMDDELPERWVRKLEATSGLGIAPDSTAESGETTEAASEREPRLTDEQINDWITSEGREEDRDPNINRGGFKGNEVIGPQQIKLSTVKGYIEMIYGGAESLARSRGDDIAAEVIHKYTPEYTEAWMDYIKFDSRILKYLEALQIGTPIGNLIGIHAVSMGAYVLARVTAREIAAANAAAEREREREKDGSYPSI